MGHKPGAMFRISTIAAVFLLAALGTLAATALADEMLDARRARVERMDPAAKTQLLRRLESFQRMTAGEQERLRQLHRQLESDPQAGDLRAVLQRYYEWLKTLKPYQKAELAELAPQERIERIKRLRQEQARREAKRASNEELARTERLKRLLQEQTPKGGKRLNQDDVEGLLRWMVAYLDANAEKLVDRLPPGPRQEHRRQLASVKEPERRREIAAAVWLRTQAAQPGKLPVLTAAELTSLRKALSPSTRRSLETLTQQDEQRVVTFWLRFMLLSYTPSDQLARLPNHVSDKELGEFLEHKLGPGTRDWLLGLPPEDMQRELWAQYLRYRLLDPVSSVHRPNRPKPSRAAPKTAPSRPGSES
jgi:hypothetical protein